MKRILLPLAILAGTASVAAAGPPPTPIPTSVSITANAKGPVVTVHVKNLTASDADQVAVDILTSGPSKHYAVHRNGPGLPITVNPIPGKYDGQSTGTGTRTIKGSSLVFTFSWKSIGNPHGLKLRAIQGSESDGVGHSTAWVSYTG